MRGGRRADRAGHGRARRRVEAARAAAAELGYPVLLKAAAGGGGKGMRLVDGAGRARGRVRRRRRPRREAAFGDATLYVEKALAPARHVEIQVLCDDARQRAHARRARVLDPAPPPEADRGVAVAGAHARAARGDGGGRRARLPRGRLRNAGTFEFLLGPDGSFYFIELNARLQVEHPVTELVHRHRPRARAAARSPPASALELTGRAPRRGHAIEIRLNAEDPARDFLPSPGTDRALPAAARARACASTRSSRTAPSIPPYYDSLIAKLVVWDADRPAAIARAERALDETVSRACRRRATSRSRCSRARSSAAATTRPRRSRRSATARR